VAKIKETPQQKWAKKNRHKLRAASRRWRARYPEKQKAATYRWRRKHLAEWNAYQRRWRKKNRLRTNQLLRAHRAENAAKHNASRRRYRQKNLGKLRTVARKYYMRHFEKKRLEHQRAMVKRRSAIGAFTLAEWRALLRKYRYKCVYCNKRITRKTASVDHVAALSRGGTNWIRNIVPSCLPCNQRKNFLSPREFRRRLRQEKSR
jgi:5-methylcytosine-specific restriction endonuclease McrA